MHLADLVSLSQRLSATRKRLEKRRALAALLKAAPPGELGPLVSYLCGRLPQGRIGLGPALLDGLEHGSTVGGVITLAELDTWATAFGAIQGPGSRVRRRAMLERLWQKASSEEAAFLQRLLLGELRQGALEGLLVDAIADAAALPAAEVRRAVMLAGSPVPVASAALRGGAQALTEFRLTLMQPLQPMLAQPAPALAELFQDGRKWLLDYKLDGARVQIHRERERVRIFTRQLHEVTSRLPELVAAVRALPAQRLVLDGEAIVLGDGGVPRPFQDTMRRFGRRAPAQALRAELPLSLFLFDCLHIDGRDLLELPLAERLAALDDVAPGLAPPRLCTADRAEAQSFLDKAFAAGHEGIMVKDPASPYAAGSRGAAWQKIKQLHTLDLVVLAAEWGSGRRKGWLSNLHLGARDETGGFVMLGKTFKGLTDAMLRWQTEQLLALEVARTDQVVAVRPELVVEIAVNELQRSSHYPGGLALRFARVRRYREDKPAAEADSIATARSLYASQGGAP